MSQYPPPYRDVPPAVGHSKSGTMAVQYNPEYLKIIEPLLPVMAQDVKPPVHDVKARRTRNEATFAAAFGARPPPPDIEIKIYHATARDGYSIPIYHYLKRSSTTQGSAPAILHIHGGGYISLNVESYNNVNAAMTSASAVQMFSVDYRTAPEHSFPTPAEDCYTCLLWLHEHAEELRIDSARIAVYGDSAGGGLAASVAIMARDRLLSPPIAKQLLIYPMIDDRTVSASPINKFLVWNHVDNITGWTAYLGQDAGKENVSPYAAAARVESVEGLPSTYIDVGSLDLFRDEDVLYAQRLAAANIEVEFHLYPGLPHGFEIFAYGSDLVNKIVATRIKAMTTF